MSSQRQMLSLQLRRSRMNTDLPLGIFKTSSSDSDGLVEESTLKTAKGSSAPAVLTEEGSVAVLMLIRGEVRADFEVGKLADCVTCLGGVVKPAGSVDIATRLRLSKR